MTAAEAARASRTLSEMTRRRPLAAWILGGVLAFGMAGGALAHADETDPPPARDRRPIPACRPSPRFDRRPAPGSAAARAPSRQEIVGLRAAQVVDLLGQPACRSATKWRYRQPEGCAVEKDVVTLWFRRGKVVRVNVVHVVTGERCTGAD
jgi:hypothetical protein